MKRTGRLARLAWLSALVPIMGFTVLQTLLIAGCRQIGDDDDEKTEPAVISVSVNSEPARVVKGSSHEFTATVVVSGGAEQTVVWSLEGDHSLNTTFHLGGGYLQYLRTRPRRLSLSKRLQSQIPANLVPLP